MTETESIRDQLHRVFYGPAWHGPAFLETLDGVDAALAARKPPAGAHTIWELARHAGFWEEVGLRRARGDRVPVNQDTDWGPVTDPSPAAWAADLVRIRANHEALETEIAKLTDGALEQLLPGDNTLRSLLHGVVHHDLYHAGQMQMLRRIFEKS